MSEVTVWGRSSSANVQKAIWALEELGVPYEQKVVGARYGGLDTPAFGTMNPNRLIPVLEHGDLTLWESHAIVRYVCARFGTGRLWIEDPFRRAIVDQWADWTATTFQPAWISVFWLTVRTPAHKHDQTAISAAIKATIAALTIMEKPLGQHDYLAGGDFTYADIVAGVALYRWFTMNIERPSMPGIESWYERLKQREAFRKSVCVSYEELRA